MRSPSCGATAWRRASAIAARNEAEQDQAPPRSEATTTAPQGASPSGPSGYRSDGDRSVSRSPGFVAGFCGGVERCWGACEWRPLLDPGVLVVKRGETREERTGRAKRRRGGVTTSQERAGSARVWATGHWKGAVRWSWVIVETAKWEEGPLPLGLFRIPERLAGCGRGRRGVGPWARGGRLAVAPSVGVEVEATIAVRARAVPCPALEFAGDDLCPANLLSRFFGERMNE